MTATPHKTLGVRDGIVFVAGIVIGVGIFRMPPLVALNTPNETVYLLTWAAGGLAMLIGMLCYAELAAAHPDAGGEYHFLRRAYGPKPAILFAWARGTVIQTGAIAYVAFVFGDYANQIVSLGKSGPSIWAAISVALFTAINLKGTGPGKATQTVFSAATVAALTATILAGLAVTPAAAAAAPAQSGSGALGLAMVFILLTYGGWNEAAYLSGEMRNPRRDFLLLALGGTAVITILYLALAATYVHALGFEGLRQSRAVGSDLMRLAAGEKGAILIAMVICVAALSTLNATIFTGARVYYALGRDIPAIARLGVWDERGGNPANALMLQGAIAMLLVVFGAFTRDGFAAMVDYTAPVFWLFLLLVSLSIFIFRVRGESERPYSVPLYPLTPALFALMCGYLLYSSLAYTGYGSLAGMAVLLAGIPLLFLARTSAPEGR